MSIKGPDFYALLLLAILIFAQARGTTEIPVPTITTSPSQLQTIQRNLLPGDSLCLNERNGELKVNDL